MAGDCRVKLRSGQCCGQGCLTFLISREVRYRIDILNEIIEMTDFYDLSLGGDSDKNEVSFRIVSVIYQKPTKN